MRVQILALLIFGVVGCASKERVPSSYTDSAQIEVQTPRQVKAVIAYDGKNKAGCLLNQDQNNYYGPALRDQVILPYRESRKSFPQLPECSRKVNAQYQTQASVAYQEGPQLAGLPAVVAYYLSCTSLNAGLSRLEVVDESKISENRKSVQSWVKSLGTTAAWTICLPATGLNLGLIYAFTDINSSEDLFSK